jgi:cbb3-type cytochrome oxidase subunit 3
MTAEEGVATFPVLAFLIFFIFFLLMIVYVIRMKKKHVEQMSNIPLSEEPVETRNTITP